MAADTGASSISTPSLFSAAEKSPMVQLAASLLAAN
jgi:hypothetical protein